MIDTRFWSKVEIKGINDCWLWTGAKHNRGYGTITRGGKNIRAHRYAFVELVGEITEGLNVLHKCDNPPCCNPFHLELGDQSKNLRDVYTRNLRKPTYPYDQPHKGLTNQQAREVKVLYSKGYYQRELAKMYNVSQATIWKAATGRTYTNVFSRA